MRKNIRRLFAFIFVCCTMLFISCKPFIETPLSTTQIQRIKERGVLLVGTTGDYRPLSYR